MRKLRPGSPVMRWLPTIAVIAAPVGWALGAAARASGDQGTVYALVPILCSIIVCSLSALQPRPLYPEFGGQLDEREFALKLKATTRGLALVGLPGTLICFYMFLASDTDWWTPHRDDWMGQIFVLNSWLFGMPMLFANWLTSAPLEDDCQ
jgi:hypothetical protein